MSSILLTPSIPELLRERYAWAIRAQARRLGQGSETGFSLVIHAPLPDRVGFTSRLAEAAPSHRVHFARLPIYRKGEVVGHSVAILPKEAEAAVDFIERHHGWKNR